MASMALDIVILAAGQGTRMRSNLPKVLHALGGRPLLQHVIDTARSLQADAVHVVHGHGGDRVSRTLAHEPVHWVEQAEQLGTGHAVAQALPDIRDSATVLILYGDVPMIGAATLEPLVRAANAGALALLTAVLDDPAGYGRILRDADGRITGIVEHNDADAAQQAITEINTGFMACNAGLLRGWLAKLGNANAKGEYYLTDIVAMAVADGVDVSGRSVQDAMEVLGVNDRAQLATLERLYQRRQADALMRGGATLADPARVDVRGSLTTGRDCYIDVNVVFEGEVTLGEGVRIGPNCVLKDVQAGEGVAIFANTLIDSARIGAGARIGPFARIRPDTDIGERAHVGNFVEVKKSVIGAGSKANHLSYIGDTLMGAGVNVGAGTITCNYDGANKHQTRIEDGVFIGSDTQLVAPVCVGEGATIGAGTTVTRDVPPGELAVSRVEQRNRRGWKRPVKKS
jgi:bifunctional UDP-N-acetylglucosamine pyrophosphorylase/glucosamine-1-phosphate N-acetyltransferase